MVFRLLVGIVAAGATLAACGFAAAHDYSEQLINASRADNTEFGTPLTTVQRTPARRVRWSQEDYLTDADGRQAVIYRDTFLEEWVAVASSGNLHSSVTGAGWYVPYRFPLVSAHGLSHCPAPFNAGAWFSTEIRNVGNLQRMTATLRCFGLLPLTATGYEPFDFCPTGQSFLGTGSIPADHQFANFRNTSSSCFADCEYTTTDRICLPEIFVGIEKSRPRSFRLQVAPRRNLSVRVKILP